MISERTEILYFFILYPSQRAKILLQSSVETPNSDNTHIIVVNLERKRFLSWSKVGTKISRMITEGAPFTFGRALGLGLDVLEDGSQLFVDGVAVFNRVLSENELKSLCFW